ncbi:aquaporin, partial [Paenibacillus farraposensis]
TKAPFFQNNLGTAHMALGFLVATLVASFGGPTGPALNPARDLAPRLLHQLLPLKHKGSSDWGYAWVPVVAPIAAAICAILLYKTVFMAH